MTFAMRYSCGCRVKARRDPELSEPHRKDGGESEQWLRFRATCPAHGVSLALAAARALYGEVLSSNGNPSTATRRRVAYRTERDGERRRRVRRAEATPGRAELVYRRVEAGETLREVADDLGLGVTRIFQLHKKHREILGWRGEREVHPKDRPEPPGWKRNVRTTP